MKLEKYTFGIGDRFGQQGQAQLRAIEKARNSGLEIVPVWNKSNREHQTIHSSPADTRAEADNAVRALNWSGSYYVDADHINLSTVDPFIDHSDFFTLDVADFIGSAPSRDDFEAFMENASPFAGNLVIPGLGDPFRIGRKDLESIANRFLGAVREASRIYRHIEAKKGAGNFVAEVSMDEVDVPQTPVELFFILLLIQQFGIPVQTIAPKFTGRFNKGVDYVGRLDQFRKEFEEDLLVIVHCIRNFGLPDNLKLSVHSGSDKFTIYPVIGELIRKHDKGIHVKTAGTTWLEEVIGLAMSGGEALDMVKTIYLKAYERQEELCAPYAAVIDINPSALPAPGEVSGWDGTKFSNALRHVPGHPDYDAGFRQLIHVGYKVASELGGEFLEMTGRYADIVGQQVTANLFERHIRRMFIS